jgi:hypothetical protein
VEILLNLVAQPTLGIPALALLLALSHAKDWD